MQFGWFRPVARFVVLRAAAGLSWEFMPEGLEGKWFYGDDLLTLTMPPPRDDGVSRETWGYARAVATGRYEYRADGMHAEVYEVRPFSESMAVA